MKRHSKKWIKAINETWTHTHTHTTACKFQWKKNHFENMRCAYRPVPQQQQQHTPTKTTMGNTKMGKGNNANGMICPNSKVVPWSGISRKKKWRRTNKEKRQKKQRNAPNSQILIVVHFNCIHRLCAAYGLLIQKQPLISWFDLHLLYFLNFHIWCFRLAFYWIVAPPPRKTSWLGIRHIRLTILVD